MPCRLIMSCLMCALFSVRAYSDGNIGAIRFAHYEVLALKYAEASGTTATRIREFAPKFLALAKENPDDETALRCCEWIVIHCQSNLQEEDLYTAEAAAWSMLASNQSDSSRLPALCLEASTVATPARERFLRSLPNDYRQPVEVHGYAYLALAEMLKNKVPMKAAKSDPPVQPAVQRECVANIDLAKLRRESAELYEHVLTHYADIPYTPGAQSEGECRTLGQIAARRLGELDGQELVRNALPNVIEMPAGRFEHLSGN